MGLRPVRLYGTLIGVVLLLSAPRVGLADTSTSTTTLTIDPSASSGSTITAADENDRSNDTSTWANAHVHSLSNSTNLGDAAAGNKALCFDAADSTDMCVRFDDTANLMVTNSPSTGTYNQVAVYSSTTGLSANQVVLGDGTGALRTTSGGSSGQVLTNQGTSTPTWSTPASLTIDYVNFSRDTATASGSQVVTLNESMTPDACWFFCGVDQDNESSFGFSECATTAEGVLATDDAVGADTWRVDTAEAIYNSESGTNTYLGSVSSCAAGSVTISWVRGNTPSGTLVCNAICIGDS